MRAAVQAQYESSRVQANQVQTQCSRLEASRPSSIFNPWPTCRHSSCRPEELLQYGRLDFCTQRAHTSVRGRPDTCRYVLSTRTSDRCNGTSHLQALQIIPSKLFPKTGNAHITSHHTQPGLGSKQSSKSAADPPHPSFGLEGLRGRQTPLCPRQKASRGLMTPQPARLCLPVTCHCPFRSRPLPGTAPTALHHSCS